MANEQKIIFNLKDEIVKVATEKAHESKIGNADEEGYGHVKVQSNIQEDDTTNNDDCASIGAIKAYITEYITAYITSIFKTRINDSNDEDANGTYLLSKKEILSKINGLQDNISTKVNTNDFNTLYSTTTNIQSQINNIHAFNQIKETTTPIDDLITPGCYYYNESKPTLTYANENDITCGIVTVKKLGNTVVQYIDSYDTLGLDGNVYKRIYNNGWQELLSVIERNIDTKLYEKNDTQIYVQENTGGYIITWIQNNEDKHYEVKKDLYEYDTLFVFPDNDQLIINDNVYIFGNLIGKMDVKITSNRIQIRSTLSPGNKIKNVHETYFIPRSR